jgi:hypothetical protein
MINLNEQDTNQLPLALNEDTSEAPEPIINMGGGSLTGGNLTEKALEHRAAKTHFALGEASPGLDYIRADIADTLGEQSKKRAVIAESLKQREARSNIIAEVINNSEKSGMKLTADDYSVIEDMSGERAANPETIIQKLYAEKFLNAALGGIDPEEDPSLQTSMQGNEEATHQRLDHSQDIIAKQETSQQVFAEVEGKYNEMSWSSWGWDMAETLLIPLKTNIDQQSLLSDKWDLPFLPGDNKLQQIRNLWLSNPEDFNTILREGIARLEEKNLVEAMQFANEVQRYTSYDANVENVFAAIDAVTLFPVVKGVAKLGKKLLTTGGKKVVPITEGHDLLATKLKNIVKENANPNMEVEDALAASGQLSEASVEIAAKQVREAAAPKKVQKGSKIPVVSGVPPKNQVIENLSEIGKTVPAIFDPTIITRRAGSLGAEGARRILQHVTSTNSAMLRILTDTMVLNRYSVKAQENALNEALAAWKRDNHKLEDTVIEVIPVREGDEIYGGVDRIDILLGRKDATAFSAPNQAKFHAEAVYKLPAKGYEIVNEKGNYFIRVSRTVDERSAKTLDLRVLTDQPPERSSISEYMSMFKTPDEIFGADTIAARKVLTYGGSKVLDLMQEATKGLKLPSKASRDKLQAVLKHNQFEYNKTTKVQGTWYNDLAELETGWQKIHGVNPTEAEATAYFTYKDVMDWDYAIRNLSKWRDKARLGINERTTKVRVPTPEGAKGETTLIDSPIFEGKTVENLPEWGAQPFTVAWTDPKTQQITFRLSSKMFPKEKAILEDLLKSGKYKITHLLEGGGKEFQDLVKAGGEDINFFVARDLKEMPLSPNQIEYRPGGHLQYANHGGYIKAPNVHYTRFGRAVRTGDTTAHWFPSMPDAQKFQALYEEGRLLVKGIADKTVTKKQLNDFIQTKFPLYKTGSDFAKLFSKDGPFNHDVPFVATRHGQQTTDVVDLRKTINREYVDASQDTHSLRNLMTTKFEQARNERLLSIKNVGDETNPIYKFTPAQVFDPMESLRRSADNLSRSRYLDDYKHQSVELFTHQFGKYMDTDPNILKANPFYAIHNPNWKAGIGESDLSVAKAQLRAIKETMGLDNAVTLKVRATQQKMIDKFLGTKLGKALGSEIVDAWRWSDPQIPFLRMLRSAAFHGYLGWGNVKQFFLQGSAVGHMTAITKNPLDAARGVAAYNLIRLHSLSDPSKWGPLAKLAQKTLDIPADQFRDMANLYYRSGMHEVGGETAALDVLKKPTLVQGPFGQVLNAGLIPFREGNMFARGSSFNVAYLEYRKKFPTKKITDRELAKIVDRADLLSNSQTRASLNPIIEQGLLRFPTQFTSYHARLTDAMWGKRLTKLEKFKVASFYSMYYGVPTGVGGTFLGRFLPVHDMVQEWAEANGINQGEQDWWNFALQGGGDILIHEITGYDYDFPARYAPGNLTWLRDAADGDKTMLETLIGAAGSYWGPILSATDPVLGRVIQSFNHNEETNPITEQDMIDLVRNLTSSLNDAASLLVMMNFDKVYTKHGTLVDRNINIREQVIGKVLGMSPQREADLWTQLRVLKVDANAKKEIEKYAVENFRKAFNMMQDGYSKEEVNVYFDRAERSMELGKLQPLTKQRIFQEVAKDYLSLRDKIDTDIWHSGNVRLDQMEPRRQLNKQRLEKEQQ